MGCCSSKPAGRLPSDSGESRLASRLTNDSGETLVVWLSLDPRSGAGTVYEQKVAKCLEVSMQRGRKTVPLTAFGGFLSGAIVEFDVDGTGKILQKKGDRTRDVKRMEVPAGEVMELRLHAVQEGGWRFAEFEAQGVTSTIRVNLLPKDMIPIGGGAPSQPVVDAPGFVGLWEWCRLVGIKDVSSLPEDKWGVYAEEQNSEIEASFQSGEAVAKVSIGIRSYDIYFDDVDRTVAKQVDVALKKSRIVRRRCVPVDVRDAALRRPMSGNNSLNSNDAGSSGECAVCCSTFEETPAMPIVCLPACKHSFHGACVQHLADKNGTCPLCCSAVDWAVAMALPEIDESRL